MDVYTPEQRSRLMSRIRSTDTKPEVRLRKALFALGFRYRKNVRSLPGTPDIVLPKYRSAVQMRGCFWHAHAGCGRASRPRANSEYWLPKLARNVARDSASDAALAAEGWRVFIVWECQVSSSKRAAEAARNLADQLRLGVPDG